MKELIALVDRQSPDWIEVEKMLKAGNYQIHFARTLEELEKLTQRTICRMMILDLDMVPVQNRFIRLLKRGNPHLSILATSRRPYHPELKDAMARDICACFRKPLDTEEIEFWLRALIRAAPSRDPTEYPEQ